MLKLEGLSRSFSLKIKCQRGNSFWRRSRLRESHASNMSFLDAQLQDSEIDRQMNK